MTRPDRAKRVDPARADSYAEVGRRLMHAARAIADAGDARHASALAILSIHAAIAFSDAVAVHMAGKKSTSARHHAAPRLLKAILGDRLPSRIQSALSRLTSEKDRFEYQGYGATLREASAMHGHAERIGSWAEEMLVSAARATA